MKQEENYMTKANEMVRATAKAQKVPLWKVAVRMGISEPTLIRWLRLPLEPDREAAIMAAIDAIARGEAV